MHLSTFIIYFCYQFVPVFEREVSGVAKSKGVELTSGFSALELFRKINDSYQPCVEMLEAATRVKQRGEIVLTPRLY